MRVLPDWLGPIADLAPIATTSRYAFMGVHVKFNDNDHTATVTAGNGNRLITIECQQGTDIPGVALEVDDLKEAVIPSGVFKRFWTATAKAAKKLGSHFQAVAMQFVGDGLIRLASATMTAVQSESTSSVVGLYPNFWGTKLPNPTARFAFDPALMAELCEMLEKLGVNSVRAELRDGILTLESSTERAKFRAALSLIRK